MGLRLKAKTPSVMSLSGWSASMPTRKLCRKEIRLHKNSKSPARQNNTPVHAMISEWKNWCVVTVGQECRGEQDIEIEQGKWRDQEIRLVYITEFHRFYSLSSQDRDSGQYHPKQQNDRQDSEIFCHRSSRIARVRPVPQ